MYVSSLDIIQHTRMIFRTLEEIEHPTKSSCHSSEKNDYSPETFVHILPPSEENKYGLEISWSSTLSSKLYLPFAISRKQCWAFMLACFGLWNNIAMPCICKKNCFHSGSRVCVMHISLIRIILESQQPLIT